MEVRYWSATHTPLPDEAGAPAFILQHTVDVTELHSLRRLRDEVGIVRRASAVEARNRDLAAESRRLTDFFDQAPGFVAVLEGPEHRFAMANAAYLALVGRSDVLGQRVRDALLRWWSRASSTCSIRCSPPRSPMSGSASRWCSQARRTEMARLAT